jgi:cytochrome c553
MTRAATLLTLCTALACGSPSPSSGPPTPTKGVPALEAPVDGRAWRDAMHRAGGSLGPARDALIAGRLDDARAHLAAIRAGLPEPTPPADAGHIADLRAAVELALGDDTLPELALGTTRAARACGSCHAAHTAGPPLTPLPPLPEGADQAALMRRHAWAADRMWEGLLAGVPDRWAVGAGALLEHPLRSLTRPDGSAPPENVSALQRRLEQLGAEGLRVADDDVRAELGGAVLATCSVCHAATGGGPRR